MDLQPLRFPTREMAAASFNEAAQILGEDSVRLMERIEAYTALYEQWKTKISNILKEGKNDRFEEIYRGDQRTTYERSRFHEADSTEGEERTYSNYRNNNFRKEQQTLSEEEGTGIRDFAAPKNIDAFISKGKDNRGTSEVESKRAVSILAEQGITLDNSMIDDFLAKAKDDNSYHQLFKQTVGVLRKNNIPINIVADTELNQKHG